MLPKKRPPTHPGEMLLKEFLEPLGVNQKAFAAHLGPVARVAQLPKSTAAEEGGMIADGMLGRLSIQGEGISDQMRHCEERSDEAIYKSLIDKQHGLLRYARNDKVSN